MGHYLDKVYPGKKNGFVHSFVTEVADVALYGGASYGYGYLQNKYREKASLWGVPADLLSGSVLSAAAFLADWYGKSSHLAAVVRPVGRAGIGAWFHTMGAAAGAKASGVRRLLISEKDVAKAKAALPDATVLGEIPKAPHGDLLSAAELARMAA